ncbi:DUF2958 domain-containing protein [Senegalia massiliensis]|uniref:DUF2958 domain-containing protein n=1 Tax=Senegalia massiliensis TaxID=1720316 RepID=A0A845R0U7_9CLOT|nr:DUF2958 domain-containing protein [Senegalia massiliensis]NBI07629.1 DUF2958 domain-containing protein [Senegalia massiliensis]
MKLLTKSIKRKLPELYSTENIENPCIRVKFFDAYGSYRWYVLEGEEQENGDFLFFGLVDSGRDQELGYFRLSELKSIKYLGRYPRIERDMHLKDGEVHLKDIEGKVGIAV